SYAASAEMACHLALGWPTPKHCIDLYPEFKNSINGIGPKQPNLLFAQLTLESPASQNKKKTDGETFVSVVRRSLSRHERAYYNTTAATLRLCLNCWKLSCCHLIPKTQKDRFSNPCSVEGLPRAWLLWSAMASPLM